MAEQNSTSTSAQNSSPKGGVSAESEFHAKFFPILARVASVTAMGVLLSTAPCGSCTVCGAPRRTSRSSSRTLPVLSSVAWLLLPPSSNFIA